MTLVSTFSTAGVSMKHLGLFVASLVFVSFPLQAQTGQPESEAEHRLRALEEQVRALEAEVRALKAGVPVGQPAPAPAPEPTPPVPAGLAAAPTGGERAGPGPA